MSTHGAERATFDALIQKATDPTVGHRKIDLRSGDIAPTGRNLDFAIEGPGFFAIQTPAGTRYTRNGSFERRADGTLTTTGAPVLGQDEPIRLGVGGVTVDPDGTVRTDNAVAGRLKIVDAAPGAALACEGGSRFRIDKVIPVAAPSVRNGALEQSNVSIVDGLAHLTALLRSFEALQRGLRSLSDIDEKAITALGRR